MPVFPDTVSSVTPRSGSRALINSLRQDLLDEATAVRLVRHPGNDPHAFDDDGRTALHWAVVRGYPTLAQALIEHGVSVATQDFHDQAAFDILMLNHLEYDPVGGLPPTAMERQLLAVLLAAGAQPVLITRAPRTTARREQVQSHIQYVHAWKHSAFRRGIDAVVLRQAVDRALGQEPETLHPHPLEARGRARL